MDMLVHQLDVTTAFLNGVLEEEIYMKQPKGHEEPGKEYLVCRLIKTLYGLKQAPLAWFKVFEADLKGLGLKSIEGVECLFVYSNGDEAPYFLAYVDDFLVMSKSIELINWMKK